MTVVSSPAMAIVLPARPPAQVSVPLTTNAPGVSCCRSGVKSRHPSGTTGAMEISISPPVGFFQRNEYVPGAVSRSSRKPGRTSWACAGVARTASARAPPAATRRNAPPHHVLPLPPRRGAGATFGISIVTLYFARSRS